MTFCPWWWLRTSCPPSPRAEALHHFSVGYAWCGGHRAQAGKAETPQNRKQPTSSSCRVRNRDPERGGACPRCSGDRDFESGAILGRLLRSLSPKGKPDLTLLQKMGMQAGKVTWHPESGAMGPGASCLGCLPALGPLTLVYPHSHQNDEKEKLRIEKGPRRTEAPKSWEPSGAHSLGPPPTEMSAAPHAHDWPQPSLSYLVSSLAQAS